MINEELCILIHHHHQAYVDQDGVIWLTSVIGRWVDALANYFGEVRLLLYQGDQRLPQQDTALVSENVKLYSLGPRIQVWKRIFRKRIFQRVCAEASRGADILLIRGFTPHQYNIWRATNVPHKAFLLVGSLNSNKPSIPLHPLDALLFILRYLRLKELRRMVKESALLMANSPILVSEFEKILGINAHFVPTNSIRKSEFAPLRVRPISDPIRLLYCGRLDLRKGLHELFQTVAILNQQGQPCQLDIVGATLEPVYSELLQLAHGLSIKDLISWRGFIPYGPDLFEFYRQADVFVLPSYSEGFPHAIWEAAANCCPVITTSVGGIPALLENEEQALLIPPKDVDSLVLAVQRLLSNDALRGRLVEQAYRYALAFTVEVCAQKLVDTLSQEWN
jgi:glycosyltransferase involved in cell wall biosynthesis